mmetsp:Transcript_45237/g.96193  ORF Transcript_45237/g.96193 Transcript_45237/m.96193 type:complete len:237 (-) Transcript_45237:627-1337(-)
MMAASFTARVKQDENQPLEPRARRRDARLRPRAPMHRTRVAGTEAATSEMTISRPPSSVRRPRPIWHCRGGSNSIFLARQHLLLHLRELLVGGPLPVDLVGERAGACTQRRLGPRVRGRLLVDRGHISKQPAPTEPARRRRRRLDLVTAVESHAAVGCADGRRRERLTGQELLHDAPLHDELFPHVLVHVSHLQIDVARRHELRYGRCRDISASIGEEMDGALKIVVRSWRPQERA